MNTINDLRLHSDNMLARIDDMLARIDKFILLENRLRLSSVNRRFREFFKDCSQQAFIDFDKKMGSEKFIAMDITSLKEILGIGGEPVDIVRKTLAFMNKYHREPTEKDRGRALVNAVEARQSEIVEYLLNGDGSSLSENGGCALEVAALAGQLDMIQVLLEKGSASQEDQGEALANAAWEGCLAVVHLLLEKGSILPEAKDMALVNAASRGWRDILLVLLNDSSITEEAKCKAFIEAAVAGRQKIVLVLFDDISITHETKCRVFIRAVYAERHEIVRIFLERCIIPDLIRKMMLRDAEIRGQVEMIQVLSAKPI